MPLGRPEYFHIPGKDLDRQGVQRGLRLFATASPRDPMPGGGDEAITVHTTAGATVNLKVHYKTTTHPFSGVADSTGTAIITFSIGRPTPGYPVRVDVLTSSGQACTAQFAPQ